jgi:hypothetical protein
MVFRVGPAFKAVNSKVGIGNLPSAAVWVAAIMPKVKAGNTTKASAPPTTGTMETTETVAMNKKNNPVMANGCRQKVRTPWTAH